MPTQDTTGAHPSEPVKQPAAGNGPRSLIVAIVYVCLLATGVFAAYRLHLYWRRTQAAERYRASQTFGAMTRPIEGKTQFSPPERLPDDFDILPPEQGDPEAKYSQLVKDPISAEGVKPLANHPGGIAPPEGGKLLFAFEREIADSIQQQGIYEFAGETTAAAEHYIGSLRAAGFVLLSDSQQERDRRVIVAHRGGERVVVILKKSKTADGIVRIAVTVISTRNP